MTDQRVDDVGQIIEEEAHSMPKNKVSKHDPRKMKKKSGKFFSRFLSPFARWCSSKDRPDGKMRNDCDHDQETLEAYIIENMSVNQLQNLLQKKISLGLGKTCHTDNASLIRQRETAKDFFTNLEYILEQNMDELNTVLQLASYIKIALDVDAYRIFKIELDDSKPVLFYVMDSPNTPTSELKLAKAEDDKVPFVREVASKQKSLHLSREKNSASFPNTPTDLLRTFGFENVKEANHLLYQPMLTSGKTIYVIEMWRIIDKYDNKDEEVCANIVTAFHYLNLYLVKQKENNSLDVLLNVVQMIFTEMVTLEKLVKSILKSIQALVNADRTSLFLVDNTNLELGSTVFLLKFDHEKGWILTKTIGIPINPRIAGYVASSGRTLNIPNAYSDCRFDSEEDTVTGYTTKSILCMSIKVGEKVIGVVEMINKLNNCSFNHEDEVVFKQFSIFFGLALNNAMLYNDITRNEQRYKVILEILSHHNTCHDDEVQKFQNDNCPLMTNFDDYYLDPYKLDDFQKCKAAIMMFDDLFKLSKFDSIAVSKFILTVKKNYRMVPYHNFNHGWSVAHSMYVILKNIQEPRFTNNMKLALFVACLCHDLDHRGYNNSYILNDTKSPLAAMYSSSPLENHHFSITVNILQQDGLNIFSRLPSEDYKEILQYIKQCILATDINTAFFSNLPKLNKIVGENSKGKRLNWEIPSNRNLVMALLMTAADVSASAKPWEIQEETVKVIFEEFYDQGDKEKIAGKTPIPMMDRNKPEVQAASQVQFLSQICIPCYNMLYKIFPQTKPLYEMAMRNLDIWQSKSNNDNFEKRRQSLVSVQDPEFSD